MAYAIKDLDDYLQEEAEYSSEQVKLMTPFDKVNAYLQWNGIIGYTNDILEVTFAAYNISKEIY